MRAGIQHQRSPAEILGDLLNAELAEKTARSIRYQMSAARFPVMKSLAEFDFDPSPANEALVRNLHDGDFMDQTRNAVRASVLRGRDRNRQDASRHRHWRQRGEQPAARPVLQRRRPREPP